MHNKIQIIVTYVFVIIFLGLAIKGIKLEATGYSWNGTMYVAIVTPSFTLVGGLLFWLYYNRNKVLLITWIALTVINIVLIELGIIHYGGPYGDYETFAFYWGITSLLFFIITGIISLILKFLSIIKV
ncbi:hypothetical protein CIB95_02550 [Lottiidibacillus patelloidae]|uniref:Uncharacterized protein n=1 Tax=Lottiidibacillus patelloidae TaxID=2670334 RepID=A0A263BYV7_9BACI|nr:hypothetical protein [Lottiidibacillus patelloidae]OZM58467.1 hypothetical protein CIB95_02550 [Lottiidibacillus patelloidae]